MGWLDKAFKDFTSSFDFVGDAIDKVVDVVEDSGVGSMFESSGKIFSGAWDNIDDYLSELATGAIDTFTHTVASPIDIFLPGDPVGDLLSSVGNTALDLVVDVVEEGGKALIGAASGEISSQAKKKSSAFITATKRSVNLGTPDASRTTGGRGNQNLPKSRYYYGSRINRTANKQRVVYR